jgi:tRNA(Ile)-lysidine synthase
MLAPGDSILVALSGGPDSVFLLRFLHKFSPKLNITLRAVHVNHLLRGEDAEHDETFCRDLCYSLDIPLYVIRHNVKATAARKHISVEEAGHDVRYIHFRRIMDEEKLNKTATAHHVNDNSETMLLNIIKGTGLQGLMGIAPVLHGNIIRPLIEIGKEDIVAYLKKNNYQYCIDITNKTTIYQRNFLRARILPAIKENVNPSVDDALARLSSLSRDITCFLGKSVQTLYKRICKKIQGGVVVDIEKLFGLEVFLRKELIRYVLQKDFATASSFDDVEKILTLAQNQTGRLMKLKGGVNVLKDRVVLQFFTKIESEIAGLHQIDIGNKLRLGNVELLVEEVEKRKIKFGQDRLIEYIDAGKIKKGLTVRVWKPGDRFIPLGMKGIKKLSDFITDKKVPVKDRKNVLVLCDGKEIVWIVGYQISEKYKLTADTNHYWKVQVKNYGYSHSRR